MPEIETKEHEAVGPLFRKTECFVSEFRNPNVFHQDVCFGVLTKRKGKTRVCKQPVFILPAQLILARYCRIPSSLRGKLKSLKSHKSFNATSIYKKRKCPFRSTGSKEPTRASFFNCMPMCAFGTKMQNKDT